MKRFLLLCLSVAGALTSAQSFDTLRMKKKQITITNGIQPHMLEYTFLGTSYSPDSFALTVNGKALQPGDSVSLSPQKTVAIRYDYSFAKGWRTGAKEIEFDLDPEKTDFDLTFSWNNKWRVSARGAAPLKAKRLKYNA